MVTKYRKGYEKELRLVHKYKADGCNIAFRSAGSHSPIDVVGIDSLRKKIYLIQSKRTLSEHIDYIDPKLKERLEKENVELNGSFDVEFIAL